MHSCGVWRKMCIFSFSKAVNSELMVMISVREIKANPQTMNKDDTQRSCSICTDKNLCNFLCALLYCCLGPCTLTVVETVKTLEITAWFILGVGKASQIF